MTDDVDITDPAFVTAQTTVVGCLITKPETAEHVWSRMRMHDFDPPFRQIAEAVHGLTSNGEPVDSLAVIDAMQRRGTLSRAGGMAEVMRVAEFGFGDPAYALDVCVRKARLRRLQSVAIRAMQVADAPDADPYDLATKVAAAAQGVVDGIESEGEVDSPTLGDFLSTPDDPYDWVVPGLLEHGDRLILTGSEGAGKSVLCRQIAVCAAAGVHPFSHVPVPPARVLLVDCENGPTKMKRALRPLVDAARHAGVDPTGNMWVETIPAGLDLTNPDDELWLLRRVSALQPDLLVTGPIYRLHAANPNDEEPARKVTRALDRCRSASNCALMTEAHTSHGMAGSERPLRPTGSSLWLRWPEFGYGLRGTSDWTPENRSVSFTSWRGDREARDWPRKLRAGRVWPWEDDSWNPLP